MDQPLSIEIEVNGKVLFELNTSIQAYAQYVAAVNKANENASQVEKDSTLALAQLSQAIVERIAEDAGAGA
ncbi:MAG: hypothetical protein IKJ74_04760 [Clostridia bacterium]|nr:hypothetical protein [Clostridia bacterium]